MSPNKRQDTRHYFGVCAVPGTKAFAFNVRFAFLTTVTPRGASELPLGSLDAAEARLSPAESAGGDFIDVGDFSCGGKLAARSVLLKMIQRKKDEQ